MLFENGWAYDVVAPVTKGGLALLGEASKIVPLAAKRFPAVRSSNKVELTVAFAAGEKSVRVSGYAKARPVVRAEQGSIGPERYDESTHLFQVAVHPAKGGHKAQLLIERG